jgi:NAD(P)-dependent dehydrogenase (short-subunit alcohol dehydrogenase family)
MRHRPIPHDRLQRVAAEIGAPERYLNTDVSEESSATTAADMDRLWAVNVRGTFNLCKALVPAMLERRTGSVINMASIVLIGTPPKASAWPANPRAGSSPAIPSASTSKRSAPSPTP